MGYPLQESIVRTVTDCPESLSNQPINHYPKCINLINVKNNF